MRTTDNNCGKSLSDCQYSEEKHCIDDLTAIANYNLHTKKSDDNNLLIFPESLDFDDSHIFTLKDGTIKTGNLMGFVGRNNTQLTISSRFEQKDSPDYFLHYMLQKVFAINLLKFDQTSNEENIWDFLLYLFPYYLKKAYSKGLYKAYKREEYNDANVKGAIDVKRHIRINIPFCGKIAYTTREHSHDNVVTQLVRHTIEYIKMHPWGSAILTSDSETRDIVSKFRFVTQNSYNKNARQKIISANLKPVSHPYFTEYKMLQKICLRILRREKLTFGIETDKVYGLLFDGAWLWEEYLAIILKEKFDHYVRERNRQYLFDGKIQQIVPDFLSYDKAIVGDAKYIPLDKSDSYSNEEKATAIYYKTVTYMYRWNSKSGYLFYPVKNEIPPTSLAIIGTEGKIIKLGLVIPQKEHSFTNFQNCMKKNEDELIKRLNY